MVSLERSGALGERRLAAALRALEIVPAEVTTLAPLVPWSRTPRTYVVTTAGGERVKIRFARRARYAGRAARLTAALADPRVASPLAVHGTAMVERWVDGETLSSLRLRGSHVDAAADILSAVHAFGGRTGAFPSDRSTARVLPGMRRQLAALSAAGVLSPASAARLERLAAAGLPDEASWGLVHGDFCDENLVVGPDGTLASIDNELVGFGFLDYDLARTWYRWPMPGWAQERFVRRYDSTSGRLRAREETEAWRAVATVRGLRNRLRSRPSPEFVRRALSRIPGGGSALG